MLLLTYAHDCLDFTVYVIFLKR